jgi:hypothetical protein
MDGRNRLPRPRRVTPLEGITIPPPPRDYNPPGVEKAVDVKLKPVKVFPSETTFTGALDITLNSQNFPAGFRGFRLISVVGSVLVDLNGGGTRTVLDRDTYDNIEIGSLRLVLAAGASCVLQMWGEG